MSAWEAYPAYIISSLLTKLTHKTVKADAVDDTTQEMGAETGDHHEPIAVISPNGSAMMKLQQDSWLPMQQVAKQFTSQVHQS